MLLHPLSVLVLVLLGSLHSTARDHPNMLLITIDDLGRSVLGYYENPVNETPQNLAFATFAVRFTTAYAASPV